MHNPTNPAFEPCNDGNANSLGDCYHTGVVSFPPVTRYSIGCATGAVVNNDVTSSDFPTFVLRAQTLDTSGSTQVFRCSVTYTVSALP